MDSKEMLGYCEGGIQKEKAFSHFAEKGLPKKEIEHIINALLRQNKLEEIETPEGTMLVALHFD